MRVVVDTPVWSEGFRRSTPNRLVQTRLAAVIASGSVVLIGAVRQEVLSGIKHAELFDRLRTALRAFPNTVIQLVDYETAAAMSNHCRSRGIQGSNTDFLICAVAKRLGTSVYTLDRDFDLFSAELDVALYSG